MVPNRLVVNVKDLLLFGLLILCIFTIYRNQQNNEKTQNSPKSWLNGQNRKIVIYNRIPKTGSTTLTNSLAYDLCRQNGFNTIHVNTTKNIYTMNSVDQTSFVRNISLWQERLPTLYHGHFAFINFQKLGFPNPLYINLIREPLERFLSYYYFLRFGDDFRVGLKRSKAGNNESFDTCFQRRSKDCDIEKIWLQVPYFCGNSHFCKEPGNQLALETAKRHLIENYLVVGYTSRLSDLIVVLEKLLPEFFRGAAEHYKSLDAKKAHLRTTLKKMDPSPETLALVKSDPIYKMEKEFYDFVVHEFDLLYERLIDSNSGDFLSKQYKYEKIQP